MHLLHVNAVYLCIIITPTFTDPSLSDIYTRLNAYGSRQWAKQTKTMCLTDLTCAS